MFAELTIFQTARALAGYAGQRQSVIAQNVANADTPGYKARDLTPFSDIRDGRGFADTMAATRPTHLNGSGPARTVPGTVERPGDFDPNGNTVMIEQELMLAAETRMQFDRAVTIYKTSLDILRTSLGRV